MKLSGLIAAAQKELAGCTAEERLAAFSELRSGYCQDCGEPAPTGGCQCENDE